MFIKPISEYLVREMIWFTISIIPKSVGENTFKKTAPLNKSKTFPIEDATKRELLSLRSLLDFMENNELLKTNCF